MNKKSLSRRGFVALSPLALAACAGSPFTGGAPREVAVAPRRFADPGWEEMYAEIPGERFPVPAIDVAAIEPEYLRQVVRYDAVHHAGTVIVDPGNHFLYLSLGEGRAVRYGVGVGRDGFAWNGAAQIRRKAEWPRWTPPAAMIRRRPELEEWAAGMPGGLENPLGARALYLYQGDRDTLYRIHGTNEPDTIGSSVSSGCIRMFNQDVIDLHRRVLIGARVVVLPAISRRPPALS
jgi:lipoprotein-anchoring transpeptidase ErfK/SrfK